MDKSINQLEKEKEQIEREIELSNKREKLMKQVQNAKLRKRFRRPLNWWNSLKQYENSQTENKKNYMDNLRKMKCDYKKQMEELNK